VTQLLALVPAPWRWVGLVALIVAVWGHGYVRGYGSRDNAADLFEAQVKVIGDQAAARAAERRAEQEQIRMEIDHDHSDALRRIDLYYERELRAERARRRAAGTPAERPCRVDGATGESRPGGEDPARIAFERACALDAERLMKWQEWARRNGLPVE
jgi:hypothetical protein